MDRSKGIGGTDIAAIVGLNPWKSPIDIYMEKLGLVEPQEDNENMWWGREMEPVLQKRYEQETGLSVSPATPQTHPKYDWYVGTPDGLVFLPPGPTLKGGVDYKTTGYSKRGEWGETGTDEVPAYYHTQAMWYMGLTGAQWWDIAVLFMGVRREFRIYRINRDEELIATLIERGREFWENHVIPQVPPPVDSSSGWDKYFKAKYPKEEEPLIEIDGSPLIAEYILATKELKFYEKYAQEIQNKIKNMIGDAAGLSFPIGKIIWKKSKDRTVTDWQKAFEYLWSIRDWDGASYGNKEDLLKDYTTTKTGPRIFKTYFKEEENSE